MLQTYQTKDGLGLKDFCIYREVKKQFLILPFIRSKTFPIQIKNLMFLQPCLRFFRPAHDDGKSCEPLRGCLSKKTHKQ